MKIFSLLSRGALVTALALFALACAKSAANPTTAASTNVASNPSVGAATPAPTQSDNPEDKMPRVKVQDAMAEVKDGKAIIIDVRGTDAYKQAHIKGALDIQLPKLEAGDYQDLPKDKRIIAYCT